MSKRSRDRQLAKLAARRQAERTAAMRRRNLIVGGIAGVVALAVALGGLGVLLGDDTDAASPSGSPSTSPTGSPTPAAEPGTQTGTVTPTAANESGDVACGADAPPDAGKPKPQFAGPPPMKIDRDATYTATIETSCGTIVIELDPKRAPQTVNSFVFLARQGYFDGQYFHRLDTSIDVVQGGDPTGTGTGGPGYAIPDELKGDESYTPGHARDGQRGPEHGRQPVLPDHRAGRHEPRREPELHDLREGHRGARRRQADPGASDRRSGSGDITGQRPTHAVYIDSVTIRRTAGGLSVAHASSGWVEPSRRCP